jgi:hypothetical protein
MISNTPEEALKMWSLADAMLPFEKKDIEQRGEQIGKELKEAGSLRIDGVGQLLAKIPLNLYIRWQQQYPGCWMDEEFTRAFLKDNPQFKAVTQTDSRNSIIMP